MSQTVSTPELPELSILEQLHQTFHGFLKQKEQVKIQLNQLEGAIFACEQVIKMYQENEKSRDLLKDPMDISSSEEEKSAEENPGVEDEKTS